jgi:hypothetical protein
MGLPPFPTMLPASVGSAEMTTSYLKAYGVGDQRRTSGTVGYVILASGAGSMISGRVDQRLRTVRTGDHLPAERLASTARTRQ